MNLTPFDKEFLASCVIEIPTGLELPMFNEVVMKSLVMNTYPTGSIIMNSPKFCKQLGGFTFTGFKPDIITGIK